MLGASEAWPDASLRFVLFQPAGYDKGFAALETAAGQTGRWRTSASFFL